MSSQKIIIPTLTEYTEKDYKFWAKELREFFNSIHIDIIDQSYGRQTWFDEVDGFNYVKDYSKVWVHLMIEDPITYLENKKSLLKTDNVIYLIPKSKVDEYKDFQDLKKLGYNLGVVYEPADEVTPAPELFNIVSEFMFMGIQPGGTGRDMVIDVFQRLSDFVAKYKPDAFDLPTSIDGGFNTESGGRFLDSKVNIIYANSFFRKNGVKEAVELLENF